MQIDTNKISRVVVTDCGSTTTKAVMFEKNSQGNWQQTFRGEAPTTVENPIADVVVGALNAFTELQELSGKKILSGSLDPHPFIEPSSDSAGIDLYLSTSSAGGGLQMIVAGLVGEMTAQSAARAALGAGAIVLDTLSSDDGREEHDRIERIRHLRPDIVLLTGGVDGGAKQQVIEIAELLAAARPRPRFGDTLKLPVIYAGNKEAAEEIGQILSNLAAMQAVDNIRPSLEVENLKPARDAIHEFFLTHVMSHAPGYGKLLKWTPVPVMPTPAAVGNIVRQFAEKRNINVLAVDIGGATTDVFSVFHYNGNSYFNRTVSANLGMSYSVANVLIEAGVDAIARWLPAQVDRSEIHDRLRNKMIRPTSIPQTMDDLHLEQAVCREALRLSLLHHRSLAVGLKGVRTQRGIADVFKQGQASDDLIDLMHLDAIIGSGGVLSHAPNRVSAALMMLDAFEPCGITQLYVDSIFMMPHLGVFSQVHPSAAEEIFVNDCLVNLGVVIAPVFPESLAISELAKVMVSGQEFIISLGSLMKIDLEIGHSHEIIVKPLHRKVDVGAGPGSELRKEVSIGEAGIICDGRGRPIRWATSSHEQQRSSYNSLGIQI